MSTFCGVSKNIYCAVNIVKIMSTKDLDLGVGILGIPGTSGGIPARSAYDEKLAKQLKALSIQEKDSFERVVYDFEKIPYEDYQRYKGQ